MKVPKDYAHGLRLDNKNGNTKWQDSKKLEMDRLDEYTTFDDIWFNKPPDGYIKWQKV